MTLIYLSGTSGGGNTKDCLAATRFDWWADDPLPMLMSFAYQKAIETAIKRWR